MNSTDSTSSKRYTVLGIGTQYAVIDRFNGDEDGPFVIAEFNTEAQAWALVNDKNSRPKYPHISEADGGGIGNCPCKECTRYDWDALDDSRPTLKTFRAEFRAEWDEDQAEAAEDEAYERRMIANGYSLDRTGSFWVPPSY